MSKTWKRRWHRACYSQNTMRRGVRTRDGRRVILVFSGEPWQRPWKEIEGP